jgi:tetratricopeptide (TPR) repeat protein
MPKIEASAVEKYQLILQKDPNSQVFAPLAEAYREMGMLHEAMRVVTAGVQRHPQFVAGLVTYGKILRDAGQAEKSLTSLQKAVALAPENILAHQLLAEMQLANRNPKEALKSFKMVLFLNPQSQSAKKAVQKLESLTADEYEDEVFSMEKLPEVNLQANVETVIRAEAAASSSVAKNPSDDLVMPKPAATSQSKALERMLSLIDAFIVRNDLEKAHALLKDTRIEFGDHAEIQRRMKTLQVRYNEPEEPMPLRPLESRGKLIAQKKVEALEMMLRKIENYRDRV